MKRRAFGQYQNITAAHLTEIGQLSNDNLSKLAKVLGLGILSGVTVTNVGGGQISVDAGLILYPISGTPRVHEVASATISAGNTDGDYLIVAAFSEVASDSLIVNPPPQQATSGPNPFYNAALAQYTLQQKYTWQTALSIHPSTYTPNANEAVVASYTVAAGAVTNLVRVMTVVNPYIGVKNVAQIAKNPATNPSVPLTPANQKLDEQVAAIMAIITALTGRGEYYLPSASVDDVLADLVPLYSLTPTPMTTVGYTGTPQPIMDIVKMLLYQTKGLTGKANWYTPPITSLESIKKWEDSFGKNVYQFTGKIPAGTTLAAGAAAIPTAFHTFVIPRPSSGFARMRLERFGWSLMSGLSIPSGINGIQMLYGPDPDRIFTLTVAGDRSIYRPSGNGQYATDGAINPLIQKARAEPLDPDNDVGGPWVNSAALNTNADTFEVKSQPYNSTPSQPISKLFLAMAMDGMLDSDNSPTQVLLWDLYYDIVVRVLDVDDSRAGYWL